MRKIALLVAVLGCLAALGHAQPATILIRHASVVDVARGRILRDHAVLVRGDRIERVGPDDAGAADTPTVTLRIDAEGRYLLPGLWDMHVHALWDPIVTTTVLPLLLTQGVTGVRDMGGTLEVLQAARAGIADGTLRSPRLVAAGPILDGPQPVDPSVSIAVATEADARSAVDRLARAQVDFIKVYTLLPAPAFRAVMAEAPSPLAALQAATTGNRQSGTSVDSPHAILQS